LSNDILWKLQEDSMQGCRRWLAALGAAMLFMGAWANPARASDHDDTPLLKDVGRHDARLTDLYAFVRDQRLVLVVATNPAIPVGVREYAFPDDLTVSVFIDRNAKVGFDDATAVATFGGTVRRPERIREDVVLQVSFASGVARLRSEGLPRWAEREVRMFAGLRDDPFIRGPRIGRNVAAVVIDLPLAAVYHARGADHDDGDDGDDDDALGGDGRDARSAGRGGHGRALLVWAGTSVPEVDGPIADLGGRALRSQLAENLALNDLHPSQHQSVLGLPPDVVILDPSRPIVYPNGRELTDDVVDRVGDPRLLTTDAPFPSQNDVPFLPVFPFLAPPQ
jgi:hypothetical protein